MSGNVGPPGPPNIDGNFSQAANYLLTLTQRSGIAVAPSDVLDTVRQRFGSAVAVFARRHNFLHAPKLPDELWCMVWEDLPLADRVRVTHVCHDWRTLALGTPRVWRCIDYWFYRHNEACTCIECAFQGDSSRSVRTNALLVSLALPRSVPLELDIFLGDKGTDHRENIFCPSDTVSYLSNLLLPHKGRIRTIYADVYNAQSLTTLLDELREFPALTSLVATAAADGRANLGARLTNERLSMPKLERLSLTNGWAAATCEQSFPAVTNLKATYGWCTSLRRLIEACPKIAFLDIGMTKWIGNGNDRGSDELAECISALPAVRISGMLDLLAKYVVFMGSPPADVEYAFVGNHDFCTASTDLCWGGLEGIERLTCTTDGHTVHVRAYGAGGARRTLSFPFYKDVEVYCLIDSLPSLAALRIIAVEWPVWRVFADFVPVLPAVERLSIYFPLDPDLDDPPNLDNPDDPAGADRFPLLKVVTFYGGTQELDTVIPRSRWNCFLATLELDTSVRLKYRGVIIEDDEEEEEDEDEAD